MLEDRVGCKLFNRTAKGVELTADAEKLMYYIENAYTSEDEIKFELNIKENVNHLRIDPANESCICKIKELTFNGEKISATDEKLITINGQSAGETFVFATSDPNINIHVAELERYQRNTLFLSMEIKFIPLEICANLENGLKKEVQAEAKAGIKEKIKRKLHLC